MPITTFDTTLQFDLRVTQAEDEALAFAIDALFFEAISLQELAKWCELVVSELESPPVYLFDLMNYAGPLAAVFDDIGFVPSSALTTTEENALAGIADLRGIERFEQKPSKLLAAKALERQPTILARYQRQFPFISLS